jgi:hypothetical protein
MKDLDGRNPSKDEIDAAKRGNGRRSSIRAKDQQLKEMIDTMDEKKMVETSKKQQ